jgi:3-oxoacyl-[acyl-carrier-protein] synthase-3
MSGRESSRYAVNKMVETSKIVLKRAHLTPDDVQWVIPHQANLRIIEAAAKRLGVPRESVIVNIEKLRQHVGGVDSDRALRIDRARSPQDGDLFLFTGFGGGLSWGSVAWRWSA